MKEGVYPTTLIKNSIFLRIISRDRHKKLKNLPRRVHKPFVFNISKTRNRGITLFCRLYSKIVGWEAMKEGVYPTTLIKNSIFLRIISRDMHKKVGAFLAAEENSDSDHPKLLMSSALASNISSLTIRRTPSVHTNIGDSRGAYKLVCMLEFVDAGNA
ncbi:hypothetical protein C4D60_Mb00t08790 [Musa balbisiana]|uniref:Uncharacterized protein n=1 Tax=Musa balbisiana TaxID=52838 RepID=A0A4S8I4W9_MUSBA|nr:hypothetical protein C4D60_Mb00t08790 [Musa balbisiana]